MRKVCEEWQGDICMRWTEYVDNPYPDHWDTFFHWSAVLAPWVLGIAVLVLIALLYAYIDNKYIRVDDE